MLFLFVVIVNTDDGDSDKASASVWLYEEKHLCVTAMLEKKLHVQW